MSASCNTCRSFMHCNKSSNLKACGNHEEKGAVKKHVTRHDLEKKLDTLQLAKDERKAIWKRNEYCNNGTDFEELNDNLAEDYTKTIAKINTELFEEYGILPGNHGNEIPKEEILANFDERCSL